MWKDEQGGRYRVSDGSENRCGVETKCLSVKVIAHSGCPVLQDLSGCSGPSHGFWQWRDMFCLLALVVLQFVFGRRAWGEVTGRGNAPARPLPGRCGEGLLLGMCGVRAGGSSCAGSSVGLGGATIRMPSFSCVRSVGQF